MQNEQQVEQIKSAFDAAANTWHIFYQKKRNKRRISFFSSSMQCYIRENTLWLDAGCGSGVFIKHMRKHHFQVCGIDFSSCMIQVAHQCTALPIVTQRSDIVTQRESLWVGDVGNLPYPDQYFDGVYSCSVLEYVRHIEIVLQEFHRVVVPEGHLIFSFPNYQSLERKLSAALFAMRRKIDAKYRKSQPALYRNELSKEQVFEMLQHTGWTLCHHEYFDLPSVWPRVLERSPKFGSHLMICAQKRSNFTLS